MSSINTEKIIEKYSKD